MQHEFDGVWTALITPFTASGTIDWDSFDRLMEIQIDAGVTGVALCGTTGESPTLSVQETLSMIRRAKAQFSEKLLIMGGIGGNNTKQTVELAKLSSESGADCLLAVTPPYNKPCITGLKAHFEAIISAQPKPICIYHVPGRTGQRLAASDLALLAALKGVAMVKEASADIGLFSMSKRKCDRISKTRDTDETSSGRQAKFFSGDDASFLAALAVGGAGVISVLSNIFPKAYVDLYNAFQSGNHNLAVRYHEAVLEFVEALFSEPNPCPTKAVLAELGLCQEYFRLPLVAVDSLSRARIIECYHQATKELDTIKAAHNNEQ